MANISTFLKLYGNTPFKELPLCEADILCFAFVSYANIEGSPKYLKSGGSENTFNLLSFKDKKSLENIGTHSLVPKEFEKIYVQFINSKRYRSVKVDYIKNVLSETKVAQFFAMTLFVEDKAFILYRGTDTTVVGWKEDFNMALLGAVPSQIYAKKYLEEVVSKIDGDIYLIGHSKGGNLVDFAFFNVDEKIKDRIKRVYNLDGPGFRFARYNYAKYGDKLIKIIPNDDVVGILFDEGNRYRIVKSSKINIYAHDIASWQLDPRKELKGMYYLKKVTANTYTMKYALNEYINNVSQKETMQIIDFLFEIISFDDSNNILSFINDFRTTWFKYVKEFKNIENKEERDKAIKNLRKFISIYLKTLRNLKKKSMQKRKSLPEILKENLIGE
jgi:hypothetical protein